MPSFETVPSGLDRGSWAEATFGRAETSLATLAIASSLAFVRRVPSSALNTTVLVAPAAAGDAEVVLRCAAERGGEETDDENAEDYTYEPELPAAGEVGCDCCEKR